MTGGPFLVLPVTVCAASGPVVAEVNADLRRLSGGRLVQGRMPTPSGSTGNIARAAARAQTRSEGACLTTAVPAPVTRAGVADRGDDPPGATVVPDARRDEPAPRRAGGLGPGDEAMQVPGLERVLVGPRHVGTSEPGRRTAAVAGSRREAHGFRSLGFPRESRVRSSTGPSTTSCGPCPRRTPKAWPSTS